MNKDKKVKENRFCLNYFFLLISKNWMLTVSCLFCIFFVLLKFQEFIYFDEFNLGHYTRIDPYKILQLPKNATSTMIKQNYKSLVKKYHPDIQENCNETCYKNFRDLKRAYEIIGNDLSRKLYDDSGLSMNSNNLHYVFDLGLNEVQGNMDSWENIIKPIMDNNQLNFDNLYSGVFAVLVYNSKKTETESLIKLWGEVSNHFYGRLTFIRVEESNPVIKKLVPFHLSHTPTIFMFKKLYTPILLQDIHSLSFEYLIKWFNKHYPTSVNLYLDSEDELHKMIKTTYDDDNKIMIAIYGPMKLGSYIHAGFNRYSSLFKFYHSKQNQLNSKQTKFGLYYYKDNQMKFVPLPKRLLKIDKMKNILAADINDKTNLNSTLSAKNFYILSKALDKIIADVIPFISKENALYLCETSHNINLLCHLSLNDFTDINLPNYKIQKAYLKKSNKSFKYDQFLWNYKLEEIAIPKLPLVWQKYSITKAHFKSSEVSNFTKINRFFKRNYKPITFVFGSISLVILLWRRRLTIFKAR